MFSVFVRQALARRPALNTLTNLAGRLPTLSSSHATLPSLVVAARPRFFSLSTPLAFPTAKKKPVKKATTGTGRKKPAKTSTTKKKPASAASKSKTKAKKPAPKQKVATKKVAKKKIAVAKPKKVVAKKVVPKVVKTPRNTPSLRPPPRQMPAFGVFFQRTYRTLNPKPIDIKESFTTVRNLWGALSEDDKEAYRSEARDISAQRKLLYDKWRHGLSLSDVQVINKYRTTSRKPRSKLGRDVLSTKRPINGFLKFAAEMRSTGRIDPNGAPPGVNKSTWFAKEAGARWRAMSDAEKKAYH